LHGVEKCLWATYSGKKGVQISSICAVFAESEIVGLLTKDMSRKDIALAVHRTIASRIGSMLARVGSAAPIIFAGGGARNQCLVQMFADALKSAPLVPAQPQMLGDLGAALIAADGK
jgi:activator of 2-hydroxyglutaryl-CoA dehydratase